MSLTSLQITAELRNMGIVPGSVLALHSSLKSLGWVDGGADAVLDGMLRALGPDGTLMAPTFTYSLLGRSDSQLFERDVTTCRTGRIPETLRRQPEAIRSLHPTHSVAATGPLAPALIAGQLRSTPLGTGSPFHRLLEHDGHILLLGCAQESNSFLHVAEVLAGLPHAKIFCWTYGGWEPRARFVDESGNVQTLDIYECPGCSKSFGRIEEDEAVRQTIRFGQIGEAEARLMKVRDFLPPVLDLLQRSPTELLCIPGACRACDIRWASQGLHAAIPVPKPAAWIAGPN